MGSLWPGYVVLGKWKYKGLRSKSVVGLEPDPGRPAAEAALGRLRELGSVAWARGYPAAEGDRRTEADAWQEPRAAQQEGRCCGEPGRTSGAASPPEPERHAGRVVGYLVRVGGPQSCGLGPMGARQEDEMTQIRGWREDHWDCVFPACGRQLAGELG
jgi:hypothetical protein